MAHALRADEPEPDPQHADDVLEDVRQDISADDKHLREVRDRRDLVTAAARTFGHVCRTFNSGSVAHETVDKPVKDGDAGVVLDRRHFADLGPDGDGIGPDDIMDDVRCHVMAEVRKQYPLARSRLTKRAILISFNAPVDGIDPTVDLIVSLYRMGKSGLWIPNRDTGGWNASDPIFHTEALTADPKALRVFRARIIRLVKAAIKSNGKAVLISFNIEALALDIITETGTLGEGLELFFDRAAVSIGNGLTEDPAGVSGKIKLPDGVSRDTAAKRLRFFADQVTLARAATSVAEAEEALAELYPDQLAHAVRSSKSSLAAQLRRSNSGPRVTQAFGLGAAGIKTPNSHGDA